MKISKEIKTAIIVLLGIGTFFVGFNFLKGSNIFKQEKVIYTVYGQVEGLVNGAKVTINGLTIGKITQIDFLPNSTKILVTMDVRDNLTFSNKSKAVLYETGLIGGKAISIQPDFSIAQPIQTGDTLASATKPGLTELVNQQIAPLQEKITSTLTSVDSLFAGVSNVLNKDSQNNLKRTLEQLAQAADNTNKASNSIAKLLSKNEETLSNSFSDIANTSNNLSQLTDSLSEVDFKKLIKEYETIAVNMNALLNKLEAGEGTAGKLLNNDTLYQNLNYTVEELGQLITNLKENPKRYVHFSLFGKKNEPYSVSENKE